MAQFRYRALDENGLSVEGELGAESVGIAREELQHRGWQVIECSQLSPRAELGKSQSGSVGRPAGTPAFAESGFHSETLGRMSSADAAVLAGQMSNVASAGLPLSAGLRALSCEVPAARVRRWLLAISDRLERGQSLTSVAREADGAWPRYFMAMLETGQRTGKLPEMLNECVQHLRTSADVRRQLFVGLAYPATLIMAAWLLLSFLMGWVVPQFKVIFLGFGTELPGITMALISVSDVMHYLGFWFLPAVVIVGWISWLACGALGIERQRDAFVSQIPLLGEARRSGALAEFCRLLSLLVGYRVTLPEAVRLAAGSLNDVDLRTACYDLALKLDGGQSLPAAAKETGRFPGELAHLFRWADQGDDFSEGLRNASEVLAGQSRIHANTLAVICEPAVTVIVGMGVGFTVIALFMPLIKLLNDLS